MKEMKTKGHLPFREPPSRFAPLAACLTIALTAGQGNAAAGSSPHPSTSLSRRPSSTLPVTSCADDGSSGTLRSVVASAASGDTVDLSQLSCGSITLLTGQVEVHVDDLTIHGPGQDALTVDGNYNGRVFLHDGAGTLTLSDLTVAHGVADNTAENPTHILGGYGGCIFSRHDFYGQSYEGSVALTNVTVTECRAIRSPTFGIPDASGGGIYAEASLSLTHSTLSNNSVTGIGTGGAGGSGARVNGGGAFARFGPVTVVDSVISGNSARTGDPTPIHQARGGGISSYGGGAIVITNSVVTNNFAGCDTSTTACLDALGGGIDADTTHLTISSSIISENTASATVAAYGGGIFNYVQTVAGTDAQISDTAISGNSANAGSSYQGKGGGLFTMDGIPAYSGPTLISGSTISGNSASGGGGGIYAHIDTLSVVNSTVSANSAGFTGGGIYLGHGEGYYYSEPMMVRNCTITANISNGSYGGGGVVDAHPHNGPSTFESTIIAGNIATAASPVYDADLGVRLGTIIGANNLIVAANGVTLPPDTISADPLLGPLQDNGGPTWTHALLPGSPAIDAGSNPENLVWDQRGNGHPRVVGISADIGAFEYFDGVDQAPMAEDDSYTTAENTMLKVAAPGMLGNDSDPDGDTLTAILVGNPSNGALTLNADGSFVYVPVAGFSGTDSFTYEANDGQLNSNVATVTIKVSHVDQPPVAANDSYTAAQNMTLKVSAPGVLGNDSDPDGDTLSAVLVSAPSNGTLAMNPDGSFIYVPAAGFSGSDSFTYAANDGQVDSNIATVTIKVAQFDQPPVAAKDSFTADENSTLKVSAPGVLGNDSDPDGDTLTALLIGTPSNGTLAMNPDGSFIYVPAVGFFGTDSFTYEASDGQLDSNVATVTITITPNSDDAIFSDGFDGP